MQASAGRAAAHCLEPASALSAAGLVVSVPATVGAFFWRGGTAAQAREVKLLELRCRHPRPIDGMSPRSTSPACRSAAQTAGTS